MKILTIQKLAIIALGAAFTLAANAGPVYQPPGANLTYGDVTHGQRVISAAGNPAARWDFVNAWPSKVTGPEMKTDSNDFAIEEMVLVHEGLKRVEV